MSRGVEQDMTSLPVPVKTIALTSSPLIPSLGLQGGGAGDGWGQRGWQSPRDSPSDLGKVCSAACLSINSSGKRGRGSCRNLRWVTEAGCWVAPTLTSHTNAHSSLCNGQLKLHSHSWVRNAGPIESLTRVSLPAFWVLGPTLLPSPAKWCGLQLLRWVSSIAVGMGCWQVHCSPVF